MFKKISLLLMSLLISIATQTQAATKASPANFPSLAPILKKSMPAIVNVSVQGELPGSVDYSKPGSKNKSPRIPPKPRKFSSIGSGVIVNPKNGIIITNAHVIRGAKLITITLEDGRRLKAKLIGDDAETDLAVIKVNANNLKTLPIGDSDSLEVGDFVVAIGNPFGLNSFGNSQSATFGIISALKRSDLNIEGVENFIQTDAAINPGNSGGALVNAKGELIGINTAIISPYGGNVGIGFAIPINMAKNITEQLIKYGSIHRGLMGVYVQHLTPELAQAMGYKETTQGALVSQVNENSPAEAAGLKAGDIITQINNNKITQASQVKSTVGLLRVGSPVKLTVKREGKEVTLKAIVTDVKKHEQKMQTSNPYLYGLALRNFEQSSPLHGEVKGVQVSGASENSAGWRAGLRPGDVIISANKNKTPDLATLFKAAKTSKKQLLVQVLRGPGALYLIIG